MLCLSDPSQKQRNPPKQVHSRFVTGEWFGELSISGLARASCPPAPESLSCATKHSGIVIVLRSARRARMTARSEQVVLFWIELGEGAIMSGNIPDILGIFPDGAVGREP